MVPEDKPMVEVLSEPDLYPSTFTSIPSIIASAGKLKPNPLRYKVLVFVDPEKVEYELSEEYVLLAFDQEDDEFVVLVGDVNDVNPLEVAGASNSVITPVPDIASLTVITAVPEMLAPLMLQPFASVTDKTVRFVEVVNGPTTKSSPER